MFLAPKVYSVKSVLDPRTMRFEPRDIAVDCHPNQIAENFFAVSPSLDARRGAAVSGG
jgi:hypothetical protein